MKLFAKYFEPYAEYFIRTTFSEEKLKQVIVRECPATSEILSWKAIQAAFGLSKTIVFSCAPDEPLHLHPLKPFRNTSRGDIFIRCHKESGTETILHISIAQNPKYKWLLYSIGIFALMWGIAAAFVIWWGIFFAAFFIGSLFVVLECCHATAMDEVPQIRQALANTLRQWEKKYSIKTYKKSAALTF